MSEASFDPSEWEGGGDSESEGGSGGAENCGVGVTLVEDTHGFRVISLTHGGPADRYARTSVCVCVCARARVRVWCISWHL
jgi:hypothetical protein